MKKLFLFDGNFAHLKDGALVEITPLQAELFTKMNMGDATIVSFQKETEQPPLFVTQSDIRVKKINLSDIEGLLTASKAELADCFEPVLNWLASIHPDGQGWLNMIKQSIAGRV